MQRMKRLDTGKIACGLLLLDIVSYKGNVQDVVLCYAANCLVA